jgi:beta,beta-carotene 9',10'-dioxygenase
MESFQQSLITFTSDVITEYAAIATDTIQEVSDSIIDQLNQYTDLDKKKPYECQDGVCAYLAPMEKDADGNNPVWKDEKITLQGDVPKWLKGTLINSNASDMEVGKYTMNFYMDGFVRYNKYAIDGNEMTFSSKVLDDTKYWIASQKAKEPQMQLFYYPTPKRMADRIPGISAAWCIDSPFSESQCDNIGIQPWLMPDKKTAVFLTDSPNYLIFDLEDLSTKGWLEWNTGDFGVPTTGATHVVDDITTGDLLGIFTEMEPGLQSSYNMAVYRITPEDINTKVLIGRIPVGHSLPYMHSFGHTADKIIFQHNSVNFSTTNMMMGKPMDESFIFNWNQNLSFKIMNIADGSWENYECDHPGFVLHTGNSFINEEGLLVTEAEMNIKNADPFKVFDRQYLLDPNREAQHTGSRLRRYYINLETKEITYKDLLKRDVDSVGFTMYNPRFAGKESRYTYTCTLDFSEKITRLHRIDNSDGSDLIWEE